MILNLPVEPMDGRYSIQWNQWFEAAFERHKFSYVTVLGDSIPEPPKPGLFLDPFSTFQWKFSQLQKALSIIKNTPNEPIVIFLHDWWFPGMESFPYTEKMGNRNISICGFAHAGAYDDTDLLGLNGMGWWVQGSEKTWFKLCKAIFVGSEYHKVRMLAALGEEARDAKKVHVTGCPIKVPIDKNVPWQERKNIVVWPHRISEDKHPEVFDLLRTKSCFAGKGIQFIRTKDHNFSKDQYYELLGKSKVVVSTASHENFGISMCESAMLGCYCVYPEGLSYPEIMNPNWSACYSDFSELVDSVEFGLNAPVNLGGSMNSKYRKFLQGNVTDQICNIMKEF